MTQLLEHEAKRLLAAEGVAVPEGSVARSSDEAQAAAAALGGRVAVKAQVPIGGRGKAGGVQIVDASGAGATAAALLGSEIRGFPVRALLVERAIAAERELYLGIAVDARRRSPVLLLGRDGGVDVEQAAGDVAAVPWTLGRGLRPAHVWRAAELAGIAPHTVREVMPVARALARVFRAQRARVAEINPLLCDGAAPPVAADVRVIADQALGGTAGLDERHRRSRGLGFDFVTLDPEGEVGLITTGAGASMLLIDLLSERGVAPINFCDVRTGTLRGDSSRLRFLLDELESAPAIRAIVVNVFAGVTDLGEFVELLLAELAHRRARVPIVVRLGGRGAEAARARLLEAGLPCVVTLEELVAAAVAATRGGEASP